ncbi:uncharacterized protein AAG666_009353 isoform 2-T2 [Megaptera novaeangliae]
MFYKAQWYRGNIGILPWRNRHSVNCSPPLIEQERDASITQLLKVSLLALPRIFIRLVVLTFSVGRRILVPGPQNEELGVPVANPAEGKGETQTGEKIKGTLGAAAGPSPGSGKWTEDLIGKIKRRGKGK